MPQPEAPSPIQSPQTATTATQPTLSLEERIRKQELLTRKNQRAIESINDEEEEAGIDGVEFPSEQITKRAQLKEERIQIIAELDFLKLAASKPETAEAASRLGQLEAVEASGAQSFATALAARLHHLYEAGILATPTREDRIAPCFHSDIEHALSTLRDDDDVGQYVSAKNFVREGKPDYHNLRNARGRTNPDFCAMQRGVNGFTVIEAKLAPLVGHKSARDRYSGQQANYLSSDECECVILILYQESVSAAEVKELLGKEGVYSLNAVAIGVVYPNAVPTEPAANVVELGSSEDEAASADGDLAPPVIDLHDPTLEDQIDLELVSSQIEAIDDPLAGHTEALLKPARPHLSCTPPLEPTVDV